MARTKEGTEVESGEGTLVVGEVIVRRGRWPRRRDKRNQEERGIIRKKDSPFC